MITTNDELIEQLEAIRTEIQPRRLTPGQYEQVGWADRPLRELIDKARAEADQQSWQVKRATDFMRKALDPVRGRP